MWRSYFDVACRTSVQILYDVSKILECEIEIRNTSNGEGHQVASRCKMVQAGIYLQIYSVLLCQTVPRCVGGPMTGSRRTYVVGEKLLERSLQDTQCAHRQ